MTEILKTLLVVVLILALTFVIVKMIDNQKGKPSESQTSPNSQGVSDSPAEQEASLAGRSDPLQVVAKWNTV